MACLDLHLTLPEALAAEAREQGLLEPPAIEAMLREELRRRRVEKFFKVADQLAADGTPPMTQEEIQGEIDAVRAERRRRNAG
jgi:hypothetical protein